MTNVWYIKNILANCDGNMYLPILHLPRVELHCKLQEKLHRVTGPSVSGQGLGLGSFCVQGNTMPVS